MKFSCYHPCNVIFFRKEVSRSRQIHHKMLDYTKSNESLTVKIWFRKRNTLKENLDTFCRKFRCQVWCVYQKVVSSVFIYINKFRQLNLDHSNKSSCFTLKDTRLTSDIVSWSLILGLCCGGNLLLRVRYKVFTIFVIRLITRWSNVVRSLFPTLILFILLSLGVDRVQRECTW